MAFGLQLVPAEVLTRVDSLPVQLLEDELASVLDLLMRLAEHFGYARPVPAVTTDLVQELRVGLEVPAFRRSLPIIERDCRVHL